VCRRLAAAGLIAVHRRRRTVPPAPSPLAPIAAANDVWTTDFKGEFRTGDGVYCYPLTLRDAFICSCRDSAGGPQQSTANPMKPKLSDAPEDATAKCKDGTYSHAKQHRGACSGHGGAAEWSK